MAQRPTPAKKPVPSRRKRVALRLGAAGLGLAGGLALLGEIWPEADRSQEAPQTLTAADLAKVSVKAEVVNDEAKGPKISIQKYKNKTGVARRKGHRQKLTIVKITAIA